MPKVKKDNLVIVRVWASNLKEVATGKVSIKQRQVGHISIEIPSLNCYMSLWPDNIGRVQGLTSFTAFMMQSLLQIKRMISFMKLTIALITQRVNYQQT